MVASPWVGSPGRRQPVYRPPRQPVPIAKAARKPDVADDEPQNVLTEPLPRDRITLGIELVVADQGQTARATVEPIRGREAHGVHDVDAVVQVVRDWHRAIGGLHHVRVDIVEPECRDERARASSWC